jgi:hypothetical protein
MRGTIRFGHSPNRTKDVSVGGKGARVGTEMATELLPAWLEVLVT